jgi:hypothetical protein
MASLHSAMARGGPRRANREEPAFRAAGGYRFRALRVGGSRA